MSCSGIGRIASEDGHVKSERIMMETFDGHSEKNTPFAYIMELLHKNGKPILLLLKEQETETLVCCTCHSVVEKLVGIPVQLKHRNYIYLCEQCLEILHRTSCKSSCNRKTTREVV